MQFSHDHLWLLNAPHLIDHKLNVNLREELHFPDSSQLARKTRELAALPGMRLGSYFELLLAALIESSSHKILFKNHQINIEGTTLGEIDFLVESPSGQVQQWETCVKFYLYHPGTKTYLGPNTTDRLDRKFKRLTEHQLTLPHDHRVRNVLDKEAALKNKEISSRMLTRGCLFYPISMHEKPSTLPDYVDKAHETGLWLHFSQLKLIKSLAESFSIPHKHEWLACKTSQPALSYEELKQELSLHLNSEHPKPMMILPQQTQPIRIFICPDDWPQKN